MIYVVVLHPETDLLHEEIMRVMHEELFQVVRIEIEWTEMQEEITFLLHADVHLQEIEGDHHMQTWNCLLGDKIDLIPVDQEYSRFLKYESNNNVKKTEKMNAGDVPEKDNCSKSKKNAVEKMKSIEGLRKKGYTEKEMS